MNFMFFQAGKIVHVFPNKEASFTFILKALNKPNLPFEPNNYIGVGS